MTSTLPFPFKFEQMECPERDYPMYKAHYEAAMKSTQALADAAYREHPQAEYSPNGALSFSAFYNDDMYAPVVATRAANARFRTPAVPPEDAPAHIIAYHNDVINLIPHVVAALKESLPADIKELMRLNPGQYQTPAAIMARLQALYDNQQTSQPATAAALKALEKPLPDNESFLVTAENHHIIITQQLPPALRAKYEVPSKKISSFYARLHPDDASKLQEYLEQSFPNRDTRTWANATTGNMLIYFNNIRNDRLARQAQQQPSALAATVNPPAALTDAFDAQRPTRNNQKRK